ncbi:D-2-hydroxyacid dehydrogenase [Candidatus Woesearchaeota archaeon]|nr:D-2-hydroxyacid dehydrogenase [Candidatus Woesearchaeota archaeon]
MKITAFLAEKFRLEEKHVKEIISCCPSAVVNVAKTEQELLKLLPDTDILICSNYSFSESWLAVAKKLKWIQSIAAGNEKLIPFLKSTQLMLTDSSGVHAEPISEHVIGYMLLFERQLLAAIKCQEKNEWGRGMAVGELNGKTVLIVGFGAVGRGIARLCRCFGMRVIATKRSASASEEGIEIHQPSELPELLPLADYVVLSLPATNETRRMFGAKEFSLMKYSAHFINIARGSVADEAALIEALKAGKIAGAALDVFEQEPLPKESPLWEMENVIITPHNSGMTPYYMDRMIKIFCSNLNAYMDGKPMPTLVDLKKGY